MIACLSISYFASAVERRDERALAHMPLVVGGQKWEPRPLFGYSREAALKGVRPGMSLRQAHVLSPHARFLPATLPKYQNASGEVVDVLADFTHLIEPQNLWQQDKAGSFVTTPERCLPAQYYVDLEALPAREALPLVQEMGRSVRQESELAPSVGLAGTYFSAQVAATVTRPNRIRAVDREAEGHFLAGQSLAFLPFDKETARRLRLLGIRTMGQFAAFPRAALQEQFGREILPLYRLARGEADPLPRPKKARREPQLARHFDPPLADRLALRSLLEHLAMDLAGRLRDRHRATGILTLQVDTEKGKWQECRTLRRPEADAGQLAQHLWALLQHLPLLAPVTDLVVGTGELVPLTAKQLPLFGPAPADKVEQMLPAIMARHETARFYRPRLGDVAHPLPESRFRLQPVR